ncbi:hypothetical protein C805_03572, partial [Eubacterium sp. 14-2]|uniref:hypothetical protein n=1 Tax=Eubacterium sp. 14-2 TaxID=1235790 RepID=UPI00033A07FB
YAVLAAVSGCYPPVWGRLPTRYSPVRHSVMASSIPKNFQRHASFDLHVLSTPPAFILSQDQTLIISSFRPVLLLPLSRGLRSYLAFFTVLGRIFLSNAVLLEYPPSSDGFLSVPRQKLSESFKVISLFSYQGSLCHLPQATTSIS